MELHIIKVAKDILAIGRQEKEKAEVFYLQKMNLVIEENGKMDYHMV